MPPWNPFEYHPQIGLASPSKVPGPNERCWCGSGKKFKKCHRNRESEALTNVFADSAKMRSAGKQGKCLHPDAGGGHCSSKAIASHTVQRAGGLSAIAEDG